MYQIANAFNLVDPVPIESGRPSRLKWIPAGHDPTTP